MSIDSSLDLEQVALQAGVDLASARRWLAALGRPVGADSGMALYGLPDVELVRRADAYRARGLSDDELLPAARAIGRGVSGMADALGSLMGEALMLADDDAVGPEAAVDLSQEARRVVAADADQLMHLLASAVIERFRSHAVALDGCRAALLCGDQDVAVAFVDLVGFTRLGESVSAGELGQVAEELAAGAAEVTGREVRLVKTIGDAVMMVSADAAALLASVGSLARDWRGSDPGRPRLRAGLAYGRGVPYGGDWFGSAVNLAGRATSVARPDGLVATLDARRAVERHGTTALPWRITAPRRFKGVRGVVRLNRLSLAAAVEGVGKSVPGQSIYLF